MLVRFIDLKSMDQGNQSSPMDKNMLDNFVMENIMVMVNYIIKMDN